jgi:hypothetical protein
VDIILLSGADGTMQRVLPLVGSTPVLLIPGNPKTRLTSSTMSSFAVTPVKIKHALVGGVTNGSVPVGMLHCSLRGFKSPLRRHLRHVLDFGLRPKSCSAAPDFHHYPASGTLRLNDLCSPVVYKSPHFCSSGWGSRLLSLKELACSFDLPSPSHGAVDCHEVLAPLFPLKLLEAPLAHVLLSLSP